MSIIRLCRTNSTPYLIPFIIAITLSLAVGWVQPLPAQELSGLTPAKYLPEIISAKIRPHSHLESSPDGQELYWSGYIIGEGRSEWMFYSTRQDDSWTTPEKVPFNGGRGNGPAFSPDGTKLFFGTRGRLEADGPIFTGIWYVKRTAEGWSEVKPVMATLDTTGFAGRPSLARNGNLYFLARGTRSEMPAIFRCRLKNGIFDAPEKLNAPFADEIVMDPWVDPDEKFLLLMCDADMNSRASQGSSDLFITFRQKDDSWTDAINLGSVVNTEHFDRSPSVSPDGKYLIFIRAVGEIFVESDAHFYRISSEILDSLRPQ